MNNHVAAIPYAVLKPFTFRGVQYEPGSVFDPVEAQCVPHKLATFVRQRMLAVEGPDLAGLLKEAAPTAPTTETVSEAPEAPAKVAAPVEPAKPANPQRASRRPARKA